MADHGKTDPVQIKGVLDTAQAITIVTHERPDGDAVGSLLGLTRALQLAGKDILPVLRDGVPGRFSFLPGAGEVSKKLPAASELLIFVDCSEPERSGFSPDELPRAVDLNIDHHPTNTDFGRINLVEPKRASTTEILKVHLPAWGIPLDHDVATCLLTGLVTDTIGFRTGSVSPAVMREAAELMQAGADLSDIYDRALNRRDLVSMRYWGRGLSNLQQEDGLIWTTLSLEDRRAVGYPGPDDADLINILTTADDFQIALIFVEQNAGEVKISWRSHPGVDVSGIATDFGGGGHAQAAGAMVEGTLDEVQQRVLEATRRHLAGD
ncbi:MAG: bifunctional oligoribonuclease/PAP phosphatase NrnA [Anaerolineales bacterium]|jgi:phosphoesterase RecJ-like protein